LWSPQNRHLFEIQNIQENAKITIYFHQISTKYHEKNNKKEAIMITRFVKQSDEHIINLIWWKRKRSCSRLGFTISFFNVANASY
jgi:hypothetical protein